MFTSWRDVMILSDFQVPAFIKKNQGKTVSKSNFNPKAISKISFGKYPSSYTIHIKGRT